MKAIWITRKGGPEVLELRNTPVPVPAAGEVLIAVKAAGINRSDVYSRLSRSYGVDQPEIPGLEVSGTIVEVGPAANNPAAGSSPVAAASHLVSLEIADCADRIRGIAR